MPFKIGTIEIGPGAALAPMAGVTGSPFRLLAREQGCPLVFSEMVSAKGLVYKGRRSRELLQFSERERPIGLQLFGSDPGIIAEAASILVAEKPDFIDLNFGCPTRKITCNGDGGALLRSPELCRRIFRAIVASVPIPVTVKIRKGWDEESVNAVEIASIAEEEGISAVTVHGRTVAQGYSGRADWSVIAVVKSALTIPVIGNGDVDSPLAAEELIRQSGVDAVMIGRAARGNPWIFRDVLARQLGKAPPAPPALPEIKKMILRHFKLLIDFKGEAAAAREMRSHIAWYLKGFPGAAALRKQLALISSYTEAQALLESLPASDSNI